jgi:hypothetical protein
MNEEAVAVFIPIVAIIMSLSIPIVYAIVDYRRRRDIIDAHHKERMAAIDRGMDLPPLPESFYQSIKPSRRSSYLLPGLVWLFIGIGIYLALSGLAGSDVGRLGLIPGGVGLALLIYHFVEGRKQPTGAADDPDSLPSA